MTLVSWFDFIYTIVSNKYVCFFFCHRNWNGVDVVPEFKEEVEVDWNSCLSSSWLLQKDVDVDGNCFRPAYLEAS